MLDQFDLELDNHRAPVEIPGTSNKQECIALDAIMSSMIVELNTHNVIHVCWGGKAHQYRARKRSILTVKIEEQNKKKIDLSHCL